MVRDLTACGRFPPHPRFPPIAFYTAVRKGDPELLALIMRTDPYFITQDNGSGAPVHFATTYRQLDMLHHLLNNGAEVNQRDRRHGLTPLHRAAALAHLDGYAEIYEFLLSRGADPSILSEEFDPYLNPGRKLPLEMAVDEPTRARLQALEKKYAHVAKAREPHPDVACFWTLYDFGLDTVKAWPKDYKHPYPEVLKREREHDAKVARREEKFNALLKNLGAAPPAPTFSVVPEPEPEVKAAEAPAPAKPAPVNSDVFFVFPGQGSQVVGMGKRACEKVPAARALFDKAQEILGYDLYDLCVNGPKEKLDDTVYSQPALLVASLAAVELLKVENPAGAVEQVSMAAGLSLGEYSALVFAGAMTFEDALRVVKVRAESMAQCARQGEPHGMLSVVGLQDDKLAQLVAEVNTAMPGRVCRVANFLFPTGRVVSGHKAALESVMARATEAGAMKASFLAVSGAFHTSLMDAARASLEDALSKIQISEPRIPVISNVTGRPFASADEVRALLPRQLVEPVQWESGLTHAVREKGKTKLFEVGPQKQIKAMVRRIAADAWSAMVNVEP